MTRALFIVFLLAGHYLSAQTSTGSWYGRADVTLAGIHNNYLTELVIKQKGTKVEGIFGYYFKDKYQSFFIHGRYNPKTREVTILNIPIIYFNSNSTVNSVECNTNFLGTLINSKVKSSLKGNFYRDEKYKYTCPDLKVNYTLDKDDQSHDSLQDMARANARVWKPQADDYVVDVAKTNKKKEAAAPAIQEAPMPAAKIPAALPVVAEQAPAQVAKQVTSATDSLQKQSLAIKKAAADSLENRAGSPIKDTVGTVAKVPVPVATAVIPADTITATATATAATTGTTGTSATTGTTGTSATTGTTGTSATSGTAGTTATPGTAAVVNPEKEDAKKISDLFTKRTATLNKTLDIESDSVRLSFYDNGEIDGDSISVFVNSNVILTHQELAAKALNLYLHLDSTLEVNEISMFAENLGKYPPNTALMVITDGKNRYEIFMSSSLTENATIRLKRKKRPNP
ncbi:hypothetical protein ACX0G9_05685 [Flavitalea flava]